ncbi:MAG TPA: gamma-glutamyltransferase [Sphingobium sp.]|uniref:gamma-glutamyltransferase n=1 Tax=Sphingobium sp. TaxID=1912891 RepID=UPI002ED2157B
MTRLPQNRLRRAVAFFALFLLQPASVAFAAGGMVASADPRASAAGQEMLRKGGSATDAAMAIMLALTVVEPESSGIGGGGFLLHHDGRTGAIDSIDGRETAPLSATPGLFLDAEGQPLAFRAAFPGGKSVGIPGNIALMAKSHDRWGRLPWADLFQPAIRLAEEGYAVNDYMFKRMTAVAPLWKDFPEARALYWVNGAPAPVGTIIRNPALAAYLRRLAAEGPQAFYSGQNVEAISKAVATAPMNPVTLTEEDFARYEAKDRPPVCGHYRVYKICGMGPPASGAITIIEMLGMLERFDLAKLGKDNPRSWHLIAEAMQLAYADRDTWLADRDFVPVPVAGLIDPAYIKARSRLIHPARARGQYEPGMPQDAEARTKALSSEVPQTSNFIAIDGSGDIVVMTSTVEGYFGSQLIANGYVLNNELTDFTFAPEKDGAPVANRVEPGKRPLSSMAPTIVYGPDGKPVMVVGAAGGRTIIMQVAKAIIAHLDWGLSAQDSVALGLIYWGKDGPVIEQGSTIEAMKAPLEAMGHKITVSPVALKGNAAVRDAAGWTGAVDPRAPGSALTE